MKLKKRNELSVYGCSNNESSKSEVPVVSSDRAIAQLTKDDDISFL